ncbi:iron chaperone [Agrococcus sp. Ld7]|uniref:iron chaperone n=1 Tax=Agrococcus sp. Ld7 TaxID=649148 RepID=UPI003869F90D
MVEDDSKLSAAERKALKERTAELRKQSGRKGGNRKERELQDAIEAIEALPEPDKALAQMVHEVVSEVAPDLDPKTWYGFPSYARDGKVLVFFQQASKFDERYSTLGFQTIANLDDGDMWATSYAVMADTPDVRKRIAALVTKAVS